MQCETGEREGETANAMSETETNTAMQTLGHKITFLILQALQLYYRNESHECSLINKQEQQQQQSFPTKNDYAMQFVQFKQYVCSWLHARLHTNNMASVKRFVFRLCLLVSCHTHAEQSLV